MGSKCSHQILEVTKLYISIEVLTYVPVIIKNKELSFYVLGKGLALIALFFTLQYLMVTKIYGQGRSIIILVGF